MPKKRVLTFMLATAIAVSGNGIMTAAAAENTAIEQQDQTDETIQLTKANILDVDFSNGTGNDQSEMKNSFREVRKEGTGKLSFTDSTELNRKVADFYDYAYLYKFDSEKYSKINKTVTMECMFKYNEFWWGEREIFSNQGGGGIGLGVDADGKLTFYAHVGGSYREPKANLSSGEWVHAVGVVDGKTVKLYVNGKLVSCVEAEGDIKYPENVNTQNFAIGADSDSNNGAENYANVSVSFARIYDHALTGQEIRALEEKAFEGTSIQAPEFQKVNAGMVSADTAAAGGTMNVNLHMNSENMDGVDKCVCVLAYDPTKMTYLGVKKQRSGVKIEEQEAGVLQIECSGNFPEGDFKKYADTRLGILDFEIADTDGTTETVMEMKDFHAYFSNADVTPQIDSSLEKKTITIYGKNELDLNGDGVVGVGDVALAENEKDSRAIAQQAAIYPYKHVVILTMDGAGNVWNPDAVYYADSDYAIPQKTSNAQMMAKRKNTYAVDLFCEEFATSFTAQSVTPAISAQNYVSILHGIPWGDMENEYQATNESSAVEYFADFGKTVPKYPSLFKTAADTAPDRRLAAFSEWKNILDGIIEPDVPVLRTNSEAEKSFSDVAAYIRSDQYKNTSVIYAQNDVMDHIGHSQGYYTDAYWNGLAAFDEEYKKVIDALKETGTYDETLIIANSDHGGTKKDHGSIYSSDMDIFIGLGGQTVNSGVRLNGGDNSDISALALYGLRMEKPESMTGEVFDRNAFLSQEEMSKKGRDVDCVNFTCTGQDGVLELSKEKSDIRAVDMVLNPGTAEVEDIDVDGGTILRRESENGKLKLTVSYAEKPKTLAKITFKGETSEDVKVEEIMLGTSEGKEVYADLVNNYKAADANVQDLLDRAEAAEKEAEAAKEALRAAKKEAETAKQELEAAEKRAEEERLTAEAAKKKSEEERLAAEAAKKKSEEEQLAAEAAKDKAEKELKSAQAAWEKAEAEKKALEQKMLALKKVTITAKSQKKKQLKVTWKKITGATGYVVQVAGNAKFKKCTVQNVSRKKTSLTLKKLKSGKKYYVRVQAFFKTGNGVVYGTYSKTKKVRAK